MSRDARQEDTRGNGRIFLLIVLAVVSPGIIGAIGIGTAATGLYDQMIYGLERIYDIPIIESLAFLFE